MLMINSLAKSFSNLFTENKKKKKKSSKPTSHKHSEKKKRYENINRKIMTLTYFTTIHNYILY